MKGNVFVFVETHHMRLTAMAINHIAGDACDASLHSKTTVFLRPLRG